MKFCTKTQDLLKACNEAINKMKTRDLLKEYNEAINKMLIELLERAEYTDVCFYKYENGKLKDCETEDGTEFQAGDGSDDGETITGYWVGEDIGGILVINEEWSIKPEILKQAVELKTANIEDVFDYYDYEYEETEKKRSVLTFKNWYKLNCK